jgi:prephenate dehydratase
MAVAFQGEPGAFSELAAVRYFGDTVRTIAVAEFEDVFDAVAHKRARFGVIPIENSQAGSIHQNYDLLLEHDLFIVGEILLQISHILMANPGVTLRGVKQVLSHPQALAQCKGYLRKHPSISTVPVSNTATAVRYIKEENRCDAAAIGSMQAAVDYKMKVLAKSIEDNRHNMTRFLVLGRKPLARKARGGPLKTSIVFSTKNIPGALFKALSVFALRDIDLFKIESRPVRGRGFEYLFYLDFAGDSDDEAQRNALNHLQEITSLCRFFGSYPVGQEIHPSLNRN